MRQLITVILISIAANCVAQQRKIESFMSVKFGTTYQEADRILLAKGGKIDLKNTDKKLRSYDDLKLGGRKTDLTLFKFTTNNKMFEAAVGFIPQNEVQIVELFDEIKDEIEEIYGKGDLIKNFKTPYEDGDGHEHTAIKLGYATYNCLWVTETQEEYKNSIALSISTNGLVILKYQDGKLIKEAIAEQKAATVGDY